MEILQLGEIERLSERAQQDEQLPTYAGDAIPRLCYTALKALRMLRKIGFRGCWCTNGSPMHYKMHSSACHEIRKLLGVS